MELKLTKNDWKLLYTLEKDARQTLQSLAKKVGLSKQLVSYMLKKYEKQGLILAYTAIIDSSRLGYHTYRVYLRFKGLNVPKEREDMYKFLSAIPETTIVNSIEGYWNVGLTIAVENIYKFYEVWAKVMSKREFIDEYKIGIYSPISHFTRTMISSTPEKETPDLRVLGGKERVDYDKYDLMILKLLSENVRRSVVEISGKVKKSSQSVVRRIKSLESKGVIQGYRPLFNWNLLGYSYYKVDLELNNHKRNKELFEFCRFHPNIIQVNQVIGGSDFEFEVFAKNKHEFYDLMSKIQSSFSDVISNYEYFVVGKPYKETFMAF